MLFGDTIRLYAVELPIGIPPWGYNYRAAKRGALISPAMPDSTATNAASYTTPWDTIRRRKITNNTRREASGPQQHIVKAFRLKAHCNKLVFDRFVETDL